MIDLRFLPQRTRHLWFGTSNPELGPMLERGKKGPPFTCLGHFDAKAGNLNYRYVGGSSTPEELVLVRRSPHADEGDGWPMPMVGRRPENRTAFVILDACYLRTGPIATIKFPFRVHEGFHDRWLPSATT